MAGKSTISVPQKICMKGGLQSFAAVSTNGGNAQLLTFRNGALAVKHLIP